ncbi:MAG TPA: APC family permease [Candidatus Acidoferrum sp.]|nr:APC family permease [Candidatus Acidoferrum sp.]
MGAPSSSGLVRTIGRWSLSALIVNSIIGGGIFGLPSVVAGRLGKYAPLAYLVAAAGIALVAACLGEVASQFSETGGPYLYARMALGRFWGIQIAWMTWLSRITAASGTANLFATYLAEFFPRALRPVYRVTILSALIGILAIINYRGVRSATRVSDFLTGIKIFLLLTFIGAGLGWLVAHGQVVPAPLTHAVTLQDWLGAVLVLVFAYGGFEAVFFATGETRNPRNDSAVALFYALTLVTVIYTLVQVVINGTLVNPTATERPLAESARHVFGNGAAAAIACGALVSIYGYLGANMLHTPRLTFALAERGDFPLFFAAVHPKFRTPHLSIIVYTILLLTFTIVGNFRWNITLSAVARLLTYASFAVALLVLRKKHPEADAFRLRGGPLIAILTLAFCVVLFMQTPLSNLSVVTGVIAIAALNWVLVRNNDASSHAGA